MNKKRLIGILLTLMMVSGVISAYALTYTIYLHNFSHTVGSYWPYKAPVWTTSSSKAYATSDLWTRGHAKAISHEFVISGYSFWSFVLYKDQSTQSYTSMVIWVKQYDGEGEQVYAMPFSQHGLCSGTIDVEARTIKIFIYYFFDWQVQGHGGHKLPISLNYW